MTVDDELDLSGLAAEFVGDDRVTLDRTSLQGGICAVKKEGWIASRAGSGPLERERICVHCVL